jgi:protein arginine N-methyltransferase 5
VIAGTNVGLETTFVVLFHRFFQFAMAKPLFTFDHPNAALDPCGATALTTRPVKAVDNSRFKTVSFTAEVTMAVHGLAGFFESTLYGDVLMSILPETHSGGIMWCEGVRV